MSQQYFKELKHDLYKLGLARGADYDAGTPPEDYESMIAGYLKPTARIGITKWSEVERDLTISARDTDLGRQIVKQMSSGTTFDKGRAENYQCCLEAEWRLLSNIDPKNINNPDTTSPAFVTRDDSPVAIIKTYGEKTCYGLVDDPKNGIVSGGFSALRSTTDIDRLGRSIHPWSIPIERLGHLDPIRFSAFSIPVSDRTGIPSARYEQPALQKSHEDIRELAQAGMRDVELVPASFRGILSRVVDILR